MTSSTSATKMVWSPAACACTTEQSSLAKVPDDNGGAAFHVIIMYVEPAGGIGITLGIGEKFGEGFLVIAQNADAEASALAHVQVGFGEMVDANQHQRAAAEKQSRKNWRSCHGLLRQRC